MHGQRKPPPLQPPAPCVVCGPALRAGRARIGAGHLAGRLSSSEGFCARLAEVSGGAGVSRMRMMVTSAELIEQTLVANSVTCTVIHRNPLNTFALAG